MRNQRLLLPGRLEQSDRQVEGQARKDPADADGVHFLGIARGVRDVGVTPIRARARRALVLPIRAACGVVVGERRSGAAQEECGTRDRRIQSFACVDP